MSAAQPARHTNLAQLLLRRFRWFDDRLRGELAAALGVDLTSAQSMLFAALPFEGIRQADLARRLGVSRQAVNELVAGLERQGLVEKIPDPTSGRAKLVQPTTLGKESVQIALATFDQLEQELRGRIGNLSVDLLREVLEADWGRETA